MTDWTPIYVEDPDPFLYAEAEPIAGRSPRLDAPFPITSEAIRRYSSRHAPAGLFAHRFRRGDVAVLDELATALENVSDDDAGVVGRSYGCALRPLIGKSPAVGVWLARCLESERLSRAMRIALAGAIASDMLGVSDPALDRLFASTAVDDATCATYFSRSQRSLELVPLARVIAVARAALHGEWSPSLADAARLLGRVVRPDVTSELQAMLATSCLTRTASAPSSRIARSRSSAATPATGSRCRACWRSSTRCASTATHRFVSSRSHPTASARV